MFLKGVCWVKEWVNINLGVVYTMNHEVIPRFCKICDWLLSLTTFFYTKDKNVKVTMEFEVPKKLF